MAASSSQAHAADGTGVYFYADYGFEYSDEEPEEEDVDIENQYYNSKGRWPAIWRSSGSCKSTWVMGIISHGMRLDGKR